MTIHGVRATWAALLLACNTAAPTPVSAPPPAVTRAHGDEASLASVTLTAEARERLGVATAAVAERPLRRTRTLPGEVVARPGGVVMITAPVAGLVLAAGGLPRVGSEVIGGQPIARLIPLAAVDRDLRAQAQSRLTAADARLIVGNSRVERAEKLIGSGAGSERAAEDARVERDIAAAELKAAQARLRMIDRTPLSSDVATVLRAPFHAVVRQVQVADGQAVAGGAPLIELVTRDPSWVRLPVLAGERGTLAAGVVQVTPLGAAVPALAATPVTGPPSADPVAGTVDMYFELPAGATLALGERVGVTVAIGAEVVARVVDRGAVVYDTSGGAWVYVQVGDGRYDRRRVEVAEVVDGLAVLSRGPEVGAEVVVAGAVDLYGTEFGAGH